MEKLLFVMVPFLFLVSLAEARWELMILEPKPPGVGETASTGVADIDGDGKMEIITGCVGAMLWHRPATFEKGIVAEGRFPVGIAFMDVDKDGRKDIITGKADPNTDKWALCWYKAGKNLKQPFTEYTIDPDVGGHPHDILVADVDGDGNLEVIANAMYSFNPAIYFYKPGKDATKPWRKYVVQKGLPIEGISIGDIDGDKKMDIVCGPYWFSPPKNGPLSGELWEQHKFTPNFRDMCRTALIDMNGDGKLDIVIVESEYLDGHLSWFENRVGEEKNLWMEHQIEKDLIFAHTLQAWRDAKEGTIHIFVAEMNQGGWGAPYNYDARLLEYVFSKRGDFMRGAVLYKGEGTHEAKVCDVDGDGKLEIVGHSSQVRYTEYPDCIGWIQLWKQKAGPEPFNYRHIFIDEEKPATATDILWTDVDGDGLPDIVCGAWWYKNPSWERYQIPGIAQVLNSYDIDGDKRAELVALKGNPGELTNKICWLKPIDPKNNGWEEHPIGEGNGDWPHGTAIAPLLPNGRIALVVCYHNRAPIELFEFPEKPNTPWKRRVIAEIPYGEEIIACDLDKDKLLDLIAGPWWLENKGDGNFVPHLLVEGFESVARIAVADINGDGRMDVVIAEERVDWEARRSYFARIAWLENTGAPREKKFIPHTVDRIICPHSLSVADLDGDGKPEIIAGEHDPFKPYKSRSRLFVYKIAEPKGTVWYRYLIGDGYEQHCGAKAVEISKGKFAILGHGWVESKYVHMWKPY
jgi:hypothetical protein